MTDAHEAEQELGFDLAQTRDNLVAWLFANCPRLASQLPEEGTDAPRSENERQVALWSRAEAAAMMHIGYHGVPCKVKIGDGDWRDDGRCPETTCKIGGVSFALMELCLDWRDRRRVAFSIGVDALAAHMTALDPSVPLAVEQAASMLLADMDQSRQRLLTRAAEMEEAGDHENASTVREASENGDQLLSEWRTTLELGKNLAVAYEQWTRLSERLRLSDGIEGTEHRTLPSERGRGRPKNSLLTAVLQHLKDGGLKYRAMGELVAGMAGGAASATPDAVKDQIRKRLRQEDRRSIRPYRE